MKSNDWNLWHNITFKTQAYRKNFDVINDNENIITEYDGKISEIRLAEYKPPIIIGEYGFSVWNIDLGRKFKVDFMKLIREYALENSYGELINIIKDGLVELTSYDKVVLVHSFTLRKDYRKRGLSEEFVEMLYRDFHGENVAIIILVKPIQDNPIDKDYYYQHKKVLVKSNVEDGGVEVSASEYYSLDELLKNDDKEINEYKLFAIAQKCGFNRIGESYLFKFSPEKTLVRMEEKRQYLKNIITEELTNE